MLTDLKALFPTLPDRHIRALAWFASHAGREVGWPQPLKDGTLLASKAKGIYKPAWTEYALSVRQSLRGPYPDLDPERRSDGSWWYAYYQENDDPFARDREYTNKGLLACNRDNVPVGVIRQVLPKPHPRYHVLGLAIVDHWEGGYFFLESLFPLREMRGLTIGPMAVVHDPQQPEWSVSASDDVLRDARQRIERQIVERRGQYHFRKTLLYTYQDECAVTACDARDALEAAHIVPYRGVHTNHPSNGLLLRADVHTLFDLGLLTVEPGAMVIEVSDLLKPTVYGPLGGTEVRQPEHPLFAPRTEFLGLHREWARSRRGFG